MAQAVINAVVAWLVVVVAMIVSNVVATRDVEVLAAVATISAVEACQVVIAAAETGEEAIVEVEIEEEVATVEAVIEEAAEGEVATVVAGHLVAVTIPIVGMTVMTIATREVAADRSEAPTGEPQMTAGIVATLMRIREVAAGH